MRLIKPPPSFKSNRSILSKRSMRFSKFSSLATTISTTPSHLEKTIVIRDFFQESGGVGKITKFLLCKQDKRVYRVKEKTFLKILAGLCHVEYQGVLDLFVETGDVAMVGVKFFDECYRKDEGDVVGMSVDDVERWLQGLVEKNKKEELITHFRVLFDSVGSGEDLYWIIRLLSKDLKINVGPKYVFNAIGNGAFDAYKNCDDIDQVVNTYSNDTENGNSIEINALRPFKPMLARPMKSIEEVFKKFPEGVFVETKYDGERIQIHKKDLDLKFYSRNLKPVQDHKVDQLKESILRSITCESVIIDGELLLVDRNTNKRLPFGSLGIHKKEQYENAGPCIYIFDILYKDGTSLLNHELHERRLILENTVNRDQGKIEISEIEIANSPEQLHELFDTCVINGEEGLVLKQMDGLYIPNKRDWIKLKKDYMEGVGDSVDLILLGSSYGKGNKGGTRAVLLLGVFDKESQVFKTVCKVYSGMSENLIKHFENVPMQRFNDLKDTPDWLDITNSMKPDFIVENPFSSPIVEVMCAEISVSDIHTAKFSLRFPRIIRERPDKDLETSTTLTQLTALSTKLSEAQRISKIDF